MSMALPRLPSGVYFNMVASTTANEANYITEYPNFSTSHRIEEAWGSGGGGWIPHLSRQPQKGTQFRDAAQLRSLAVDDPSLHRPSPQKPQYELCLPLLSVSVDMQVDCNIAKTKLVQTFTNHGGISIPEAWYSFPLYDGAAVTAFRCEVGDDKVLEGKVKPKAEAKREFERAVRQREAAALFEEMTPDVFQTTIGNVKPRAIIKVEITYVEELHADLNGDGIVVTIPTSVAPRYGEPPAGYATNSAVKETGLSLVISVASPGPIGNIICRSGHEISVEHGKLNHLPEAASFEALAELQKQADSGLNPRHILARLSNTQTAMDRDIVLFIPSSDGFLLKSRVLLSPSNGSDHAAMMVTVYPSELFSDLRESMDEFDGEVLFLADRSGSMEGPKIQSLKDALLLFLKSLPAKSKFNLYSFGDYVSSLWPRSRPYDESTMQEALDHISTFQADLGGTEVLRALRKAVDDRRATDAASTQVILLTDGEIWQSERTIEFVRLTTSEAEGQLRFFSLGLGNQVSHQLIQGIGFFGGGFGEAISADPHGKWKEAVIRMLKGALMPNSWSYSISFGGQWREERLDVNSFSPRRPETIISGVPNEIAGPVNPSFVQAPREIPWLHHFGQQSVYFLLDTTSDNLPDQVGITACSQYGGTKMATLAVTKTTSNNSTIQHLAAKAAVRDLERHETSEAAPSNQIRENAEQLCQLYTISSKWTSFVAVNHLQQSEEHEDVEVSLYKAPLVELDLLKRPGPSLTNHGYEAASEHSWSDVRSNTRTGSLTMNTSPYQCCSQIDFSSFSQHAPQIIFPSNFPSDNSTEFPSYIPPGPSKSPIQLLRRLSNTKRGSMNTPCLTDIVTTNPPMHAMQAACPKHLLDTTCSMDTTSQVGCSVPLPLSEDEGETEFPSFKRIRRNSTVSATSVAPEGPNNGALVRDSPAGGEAYRWMCSSPPSSSPDHMPTGTVYTPTIDWQEVIRGQRADGLFHLDKSLEHRMAQHFCYGTRQALTRWLLSRVKSSVADSAEQSINIRLLADTMMALAYIRSHFYSERAMWDLLVQKAEWRLASHFNPGEWAEPHGLPAILDLALMHAHYGRCSQGSSGGSGWRHDLGSGRCGVCIPQTEEWPSSVMHDDEFGTCAVSGCDVSVGKWDEFWAHAVEQGHIYSSCEAARSRYSEVSAKAKGDNASEGVQKAESNVVQEDSDQHGRNQSATLKRKRDVADVVS